MSKEKSEILEHLVEYLQQKIDSGEHKIFFNDLMWYEKTIDCINAINNTLEEIERLNNIIKELEKLELYEYTPDYDYDENLVDGYTPFNIENYIEELKGSDKD